VRERQWVGERRHEANLGERARERRKRQKGERERASERSREGGREGRREGRREGGRAGERERERERLGRIQTSRFACKVEISMYCRDNGCRRPMRDEVSNGV
jgi:hypothetical protein